MTFDYLTIDELGELNRGKSKHRPRDDQSLYGGNYPFIQTGDVKHSPFYITTYTQTYNEKGLAQSKLWKKGTLCITIAANIADTAFLSFDACFPDSILGFIPYKNKSDSRFVKYCFDVYKTTLEAISKGTTQDNLSLDKIRKIKFKILPLPIQRKIAAVLSAYDDLIENNNRRIAILEKMAEELYREWFVRLRFPGHEKVKIVKGVPEGWEVKRIGECYDYLEGPGIRNWQYTQTGIPFINIRLINNGDIDISSANFISESEAYGKYAHFLLQEKDYILSTSGSIGRGAVVQDYHLPLSLNTSVIRFRPLDGISYSFMYEFLKSSPFISNVEILANGSAQLNFGPTHLNGMKFICPDSTIMQRFCFVVEPMHKQISTLRKSLRILISTRNRLLSRLMSGKIDLENLDIQFPASMPALSEVEGRQEEACNA